MSTRLELGISRTNNSLEAFFHVWNGYLNSHPTLSSFMRRVVKEDIRWRTIIEDFRLKPVDGTFIMEKIRSYCCIILGIRGGLTRKRKWIKQDQNLQHYLANFNNTEPLVYLRRVAYKISQKL